MLKAKAKTKEFEVISNTISVYRNRLNKLEEHRLTHPDLILQAESFIKQQIRNLQKIYKLTKKTQIYRAYLQQVIEGYEFCLKAPNIEIAFYFFYSKEDNLDKNNIKSELLDAINDCKKVIELLKRLNEGSAIKSDDRQFLKRHDLSLEMHMVDMLEYKLVQTSNHNYFEFKLKPEERSSSVLKEISAKSNSIVLFDYQSNPEQKATSQLRSQYHYSPY